MKIFYLAFSLLLLFSCFGHELKAQEVQSTDEVQQLKQELEALKSKSDAYKPGTSKLLLRGFAYSGLQITDDAFSFSPGGWNPVFVYKQSDRLLFEGEMELELKDGAVEVGLGYANISYLLSQTVTLRAGKILVPFGIFGPNLHPAWINKFPTTPLGAGHDGIIPSSDLGLELRGGAYIADLKFNYSVYAVNGSQLNDGIAEPEEAGIVHHGIAQDNNKGKTLGGRLGLFPFSNSSLELGVSGMYGRVGTDNTRLEGINTLHYAIDLSYVKSVSALSSVIDVKAQYSGVNVDNATYPDHENPDNFVTFDNSSTTWFAQFAIRPALLENKFLRNLELAGRYSTLQTPKGSEWEADDTQIDVGINYWLDWRTVLKMSYRISSGLDAAGGGDPGHGGNASGNAFYVQWAIGF